MRPALISLLQKVPARPPRPRLKHMDPSSPIEKHFVLPPILYEGCQHISLSIASYHHAQELTRPAKKWLAKSHLNCYTILLYFEHRFHCYDKRVAKASLER